MKAIFSSFRRRVNVDRGQDSSDSPRKSRSAAVSSSNAAQPRVIYSSFGTPAGSIGDVPAKPLDHRATANHDSTSSNPWASRFSSSPRATPPHRRRGAEQVDVDTPTSSLPSHPPSSYKEPSRQVSSSSPPARGIVRKWSIAGRRDSSPSIPPSSGPVPPLASSSAPKQRPSYTGLGSDASPTTDGVAKADISVMTSAELATRLNELAVANADSLLSDDEYRTLRQAVFDQMLRADKHSMAAPTDTGLTGIGLQSQSRNADVAAASNAPNGNGHLSASPPHIEANRSRSSLGHGDQRATSIHSARSGTSSSFQNVSQSYRNRRQNSQDSHTVQDLSNGTTRSAPIRRDSAGVSSQLSSGDGHSQRALSFRTQHSSTAKSISRMSTLGRIRAGSQARREQAESAARDMEDAFSAERTARSLRAVLLYDAGSTVHSIVGTATHDKSPTSLRAEVAPTTMFGAEYVDKSSSEIQAEMGVVLAEGNRMLGTFTVLEDALLAKHLSLEPVAVKRVVETLRDSNPLACVSSLAMPDREGQGVRISRAPPPSSYRPPATTKSTHTPPHDSAYQLEEATASAEMVVMQTELASIYTQKAAVVKRYQERLAFLQSKLRSAAIREGLK